jgi:rfaE bifunctional protein nucleotidyltransferase chain/domain
MTVSTVLLPHEKAPTADRPEAKVKSLGELTQIAKQARADGETVVLAHGTFDLLHIGHLRHLRLARRQGSMLIVTLTADAFVNKGPGRPVFSEHMRAEFLAELDCVDYVGIHHAALAVDAIRKIRPHVYAKGADYRNAADDVTGGIIDERAAVERHGGRVFFTDDVTYSSTALINRHLAIFEPGLEHYLEAQRDKGLLGDLLALLDRVKDMRVLMVGDAIIDEYCYVSAIGKSPKEHMIATLFNSREVFAGGVFAAANHVANFCREVELITTIGDDGDYEKVIRTALKPNVRLSAFRRKGKPTTRKTRFIDRGYLRKMFEVYHMDDAPTPTKTERDVAALIAERAGDFDLAIVTDFGHGLLTPTLIATLTRSAPFLAVNAQSNSANMGFNLITRYAKADYVCIDLPEARLAVSDRHSDVQEITGRILPSRIDCPRVVVTHGMNGCFAHERGTEDVVHIPAFTKSVVDTVGAGDAFFSVTAPLAAAGGAMEKVAFIGNAAGAIKVGIVGHRSSVERVPLIKFLNTLLK